MDKSQPVPLKPGAIAAIVALLLVVGASTIWGWWNNRGASRKATPAEVEAARYFKAPAPMEGMKFIHASVDFRAFDDLVPYGWANQPTASTPKRLQIKQLRRTLPGPSPFLVIQSDSYSANETFNKGYPKPDPQIQTVSPEIMEEFQNIMFATALTEGLQPASRIRTQGVAPPIASLSTTVKTYQFDGLVGFKFDTSLSLPTPNEYKKLNLTIYPGHYTTGVYIVEKKDALKVMEANLVTHLKDVLHREITPKSVLRGAFPPGSVPP